MECHWLVGFWSLLTCDATVGQSAWTSSRKNVEKSAAPRGALGSFDDEEMCEFLAKKRWFFGNSNDIFGFFSPRNIWGKFDANWLEHIFQVGSTTKLVKRSLKSGNLHHFRGLCIHKILVHKARRFFFFETIFLLKRWGWRGGRLSALHFFKLFRSRNGGFTPPCFLLRFPPWLRLLTGSGYLVSG